MKLCMLIAVACDQQKMRNYSFANIMDRSGNMDENVTIW